MGKCHRVCTTTAAPVCCTHTFLWVSYSSEKLTNCYNAGKADQVTHYVTTAHTAVQQAFNLLYNCKDLKNLHTSSCTCPSPHACPSHTSTNLSCFAAPSRCTLHDLHAATCCSKPPQHCTQPQLLMHTQPKRRNKTCMRHSQCCHATFQGN